jgi:membrane protein DedA with SNARE-associated domain
VEDFIRRLSALNPLWVYLSVSGIAFVENLFPPLPSDIVVLFAGSLVGIGTIDFTLALIGTTIGSTLGFLVMYKIGDWFGIKILEAGKMPFIPVESVHKVEGWFRKYGYFLIVVNRFLSGTRAVVSFFAGMSELSPTLSIVLSFISALIWNCLLLFAGQKLGQNWQLIAFYMESYSKAVTGLILIVILAVAGRIAYRQLAKKNAAQSIQK